MLIESMPDGMAIGFLFARPSFLCTTDVSNWGFILNVSLYDAIYS